VTAAAKKEWSQRGRTNWASLSRNWEESDSSASNERCCIFIWCNLETKKRIQVRERNPVY